ncbi:MAG: ABC transporter permease [Armatimonadota bacterium]|nr:MAG: ABC transporter permease [Armatimonadota bacterium]
MVWFESLKVALACLWANKLRSALTMLGVIFGVCSVIVMVAIVEGARAEVVSQFSALGSRLIIVFFSPERGQRERITVSGLRLEDADAIREKCRDVAAVSPETPPLNVDIHYGAREVRASVVGAQRECMLVRDLAVARGRFINREDEEDWRKVCVLGSALPSELFGSEDPLGKEIEIEKIRVTVIGVLEEKGRAFGEELDERVYVPITTVQKRVMGSVQLGVIFALARSDERSEAAADQIWEVLMKRYDNQRVFTVDTQSRILDALGQVLIVFEIVLGGIGGLSLLVGGIGIMNIMLVSVTERTREIGLRKALGAKRRHILWQFLTESATLSGVGGLFGIALGALLSWLVGHFAKDYLPTAVPLWAAALGFFFAAAVGLFFGIYPAFRAARLDPIEALRHE